MTKAHREDAKAAAYANAPRGTCRDCHNVARLVGGRCERCEEER